jgi:colanic acid/amylovoran biosynthesis glycosyltransferase
MYTHDQLVSTGAPERRVAHHPLGIDIESIPFKWDSGAAEVTDTVRIITVARLIELKGIDYAIRAVARLKDRVDIRVEYHIVGDGEERAALKELATEVGISDAVIFHGHITRAEVLHMLADSDIFVLPSLEEAFGMVLLEAQAVGLPVVATDVGGIPEAIDRGESGFLVPSRSTAEIESELYSLIQNASNWEKIGKKGREYVTENFDVDPVNDELVTHYESLLK